MLNGAEPGRAVRKWRAGGVAVEVRRGEVGQGDEQGRPRSSMNTAGPMASLLLL